MGYALEHSGELADVAGASKAARQRASESAGRQGSESAGQLVGGAGAIAGSADREVRTTAGQEAGATERSVV